MRQRGFLWRHMLALANRGYLLLTVVVCNFLFTTTAFSLIEGVGWFKSLYWAVVSAFTVGYGDVLPSGTAGMVLTIFTIISYWYLLLLVAAKLITTLILDADKFTHEEQEQLKAALQATNAQLSELTDNLLTHEEQVEIMQALKALTQDILTREEQEQIIASLDRIETAVQQ